MADLDWFPVEPGRYLKNTLHLTARQHGAYWLWIFAAFEARGDLPGTDAGLMAIGKLTPKDWKEDGQTLKAFLTREGDKWVHEFARHLRADAEERVSAKSRAGQEGARKRWDGRRKGDANGTAMASPPISQWQNDAHLHLHLQQQEQDLTPTDQVERAAARPRTPKEKADGKFKLPADWRPDVDCRAYAQDRGLDPDCTADVFTDHFHNRKGKSERRDAAGWVKRWEIWCRADAARPVGTTAVRPVRPAGGGDAFYDQLARIADRD